MQRHEYLIILTKETPSGRLTTKDDPQGIKDVAAILLRERDFRKLMGVVNAAKAYAKACENFSPIDPNVRRLLMSVERLGATPR